MFPYLAIIGIAFTIIWLLNKYLSPLIHSGSRRETFYSNDILKVLLNLSDESLDELFQIL